MIAESPRPRPDAQVLLFFQCRRRAIQPVDGLARVVVRDDQRRQHTHDIVAGCDRQKFFRAQGVDQLTVRHFGLDTEQQSFAAHFGNDFRMPVLHLGQPLLEQ